MLMTWRLMISNKERAVATSLAQALVMRDQRYLHAKIYWQVINFCDFLGLLHTNYDKDIPNLQNVSQDLTGEYLAYLFSTCQCMPRSSNPFFTSCPRSVVISLILLPLLPQYFIISISPQWLHFPVRDHFLDHLKIPAMIRHRPYLPWPILAHKKYLCFICKHRQFPMTILQFMHMEKCFALNLVQYFSFFTPNQASFYHLSFMNCNAVFLFLM